ncbi:hypothetical protein HELRODRAFT_178526 [Helobdella robusta]|uniref:C-type lectin domain-containing protein n=1 Tax=Helobdella robusta TaxID=6412 RepID=T1FDB2_HELRO|nr:hypothetical protein HELRODRAFT_178526 [Helobdella robusta]ESN97077.1 hypothetical protein HELRODRAFT_178526 [Helobdella robusta]
MKIIYSSLVLMLVLHESHEVLHTREISFVRAYSYIVVNNQKTDVCFDTAMSILKKLKAVSVGDCIYKCLKATNMNLKGINFVRSGESCSCVPKMNVLYNVTNLKKDCLAFMACSIDCPPEFEYVVESHKCYNFQSAKNTWNNSRKLCNNLLNSHPVVFDDSVENYIIGFYIGSKC